LYPNLRLWSILPNESSFDEIRYEEAGSKQLLVDFYKVLATVNNMACILDYQAVQPISKTGDTTFVIPFTPSRATLASIQIGIPTNSSFNNQVQLIASVGVKGITNISQVLFRIFRDGQEIFNTQVGIESTDSEQYYIQTFQAIDSNISAGCHIYTLTVENLTAGASADVVGPLTFSGLAIRSC
jgi:hypothetical protein